MATQTLNTAVKKPGTLRAIFILNAVKIFICLGFYIVFASGSVEAILLDPTVILYTLIAYVVTFAAIVFSILKKSIWGMRIAILLDFASSIPAPAPIGFLISGISFGLSFAKPVKRYFNA